MAELICRARFRVRCLLHRRAPADGELLTLAEALELVTIWRGWRQQAPEPAYSQGRPS